MGKRFPAPVGPARPAVLVVSVLIELLLCLFIDSLVRIRQKDRCPSVVCSEWRAVVETAPWYRSLQSESCHFGYHFTDVINVAGL